MSKPITTTEMLAEVRREIAVRERVYPGWVAKGTLKNEIAQRRIDVLEAVVKLLADLGRPETFPEDEEDSL